MLTSLATAVGHVIYPTPSAYFRQMDPKSYKSNVQKYFFAEGGSLPLIHFTGNNFMTTWDAGAGLFRWTRLVLLDHFEEGSLQHLN